MFDSCELGTANRCAHLFDVSCSLEICSGESEVQRIDVFAILPGRCFNLVEDYERSLANDDESSYSKLIVPSIWMVWQK